MAAKPKFHFINPQDNLGYAFIVVDVKEKKTIHQGFTSWPGVRELLNRFSIITPRLMVDIDEMLTETSFAAYLSDSENQDPYSIYVMCVGRSFDEFQEGEEGEEDDQMH